MAGFFPARQAGDLAVGKPFLRKYPTSLTVGEALRALRSSGDSELSLWEELCPRTEKPIRDVREPDDGDGSLQGSWESLWRCVGRVAMVDLVCFLARDDSLADQPAALRTPAASIVADTAFAIQHVDSRSKLIDALAHVLDGAQHLVVSIDRSVSSRLARYNSVPMPRRAVPQAVGKPKLDSVVSLPTRMAARGVQEYCWLTPEDLLQFLLSCIGLFSPLPMMTIQQLEVVRMDVLTVQADAAAITAVPLLQRAAREMTAVAVVDAGKLVGELSPFTIRAADERAALALATLSVREFLASFHDGFCPPSSLLQLMHARLCAKLVVPREALLSDSDSLASFPSPLRSSATMYSLDSGEESSSDEDLYPSPTSGLRRPPPPYPSGNMCRPWSSLVAVMAQALTHRVGYIWVTDDENSLLGIVTYLDIIHCILSHLYSD